MEEVKDAKKIDVTAIIKNCGHIGRNTFMCFLQH